MQIKSQVNINWVPGPLNTNWGPGPGAKQKAEAGKYKHFILDYFFKLFYTHLLD